jgi:hypothetical protein
LVPKAHRDTPTCAGVLPDYPLVDRRSGPATGGSLFNGLSPFVVAYSCRRCALDNEKIVGTLIASVRAAISNHIGTRLLAVDGVQYN